jgi:type IV secretory pathway VirD2 relaxase
VADSNDLPIFRPRFGSGRRPTSGNGAASFRNAVLSSASRVGRALKAVLPGRRRSQIAVARPDAASRRVVVKAHLVRLTASGAKAAALHLRYIERDGVEKDGSKGVLYGPDGAARAEAFEQPRPGERHQFRLIVSPEDADRLELTEYIREYMRRVEKDLGRKLEWAAVNHYDTDHPHAHVVIRGVDRHGRELRLDRGYISNGMRWRAQELATEELGPRKQREVERTHAKEIAQERFTSLDRELNRRATGNRIDIASLHRPGAVDRPVLVSRLEHLEQLGLAQRAASDTWTLTEGWQQQLQTLGARGDILKQIHAAMAGDPSRYHIMRPGEALSIGASEASQVVTGRVAAKGLSDELKGAFYAVVETPAGRAYHVPLDPRTAEGIRSGDVVSLTTKPESPVRAIDRLLHERASANQGVFRLDTAPADQSKHHERRLRELEQLGLATRIDPQGWKLAPDLLTKLAQLPQPAQRHRLLVHKQPLDVPSQVRHPGPVWLDRVRPKDLAPYGFGAELQRLVQQRQQALREMGVRPDDPNRAAKLRELEAGAVGRSIASRSGQTFLDTPPPGFRGRLEPTDAAGGSSAYAVVSDGSRFIVVRVTPAIRASQGKSVTVSRNGKGRLVVRPAPDKDMGL